MEDHFLTFSAMTIGGGGRITKKQLLAVQNVDLHKQNVVHIPSPIVIVPRDRQICRQAKMARSAFFTSEHVKVLCGY